MKESILTDPFSVVEVFPFRECGFVSELDPEDLYARELISTFLVVPDILYSSENKMDTFHHTFFAKIYEYCNSEKVSPRNLLIKNVEDELVVKNYTDAISVEDVYDENEIDKLLKNLQKEYMIDVDSFCHEYTLVAVDENDDKSRDKALKVINYIRGKRSLENYPTFDAMYEYLFDPLFEDIDRDIDKVEETMNMIAEIDNTKGATSNLENSFQKLEDNVISQFFSSSVTWKGEKLTKKKGLEFFRLLQCSKQILYIHYVDTAGKDYYKLYTGDDIEETVPYNRVVSNKKRDEKKGTIRMIFWVGKGDIEKAKPSTFFKILIDLEKSELIVKVPNVEAHAYTLEVQKILKTVGSNDILFGRLIERYATVEYILDIPETFVYNEAIFTDLVSENPLFKNVIFIDERVSPVCKRKFIKYTHCPFLSKDFRTKEGNYPGPHTSFRISEVKKKKDDGLIVKKLRLLISKADSDSRNGCYNDIHRCITMYFSGVDSFDNANYASKLTQDIANTVEFYAIKIQTIQIEQSNWESLNKEDVYKKSNISYEAEIRHKNLRRTRPDIFSRGFKRLCQGSKAPTIYISEKTAKVAAERLEREYMPFPPTEQKKVYIICEDRHNKYPTIINNLDPETADKYRYLPCCTNDPKRGSLYRSIYLNQEDNTEKTQVRRLTANKFLKIGAMGSLENTLNNFLAPFFNERAVINVLGLSRTPSVNSFLHCYYYATDESVRLKTVLSGSNFLIQESYDDREIDMKERRRELINRELAVCKQENFDISEEELKNRILDEKSFLDPSRYYRLFEDKYDIYVFENSPKAGESERLVTLDVPRCKIFHSRERKNRECIIIFKNYGPNVLLDIGISPQCELVVHHNIDGRKNYIFPPEVSQACFDALMQIQNVTTWIGKDLIQFNNIPFLHMWSTDIGKLVQSQVIDSTGHARVFNISHNSATFSLFVPPSQPLNVKRVEHIHKNINISMALSLMSELGDATGCSVKNEKMTGLWFKYKGIEEGVYVPIKPVDYQGMYNILSDPPIVRKIASKNIARVTKLKMYAETYKMIIEWLFFLYRNQHGESPEDFLETFCLLSEGNKDSLREYDFSNLSDLIPDYELVTKAIVYLSENTKGLVEDGKIRIYNEALYNKTKYIVSRYEWKTRDLTYKFEESFTPLVHKSRDNLPNTVTLYSNEEVQVYIARQSDEYKNSYDIKIHCSVELAARTSPYICRTYEGYFLTQNLQTKDSEVQRCVGLTEKWLSERTNDGEAVVPSNVGDPVVFYVIKKSGFIQKYGKYKNKNYKNVVLGNPYVRILRYGNIKELESGRFLSAALLPL